MNVMFCDGRGAVMLNKTSHIADAVSDTLLLMKSINDAVKKGYGKKKATVFREFIIENVDLAFMDDDEFDKEIHKRKSQLASDMAKNREDTVQMVEGLQSSINGLKESCPEIADELDQIMKAIHNVNKFFGGDDE